MLDRALSFIEEHGTAISDQSSYLNEYDWTAISSQKDRMSEFKLQVKMLYLILDKLKYVKEEAGVHLNTNEKIIEFVTDLSEEIDNFFSRTAQYFKDVRYMDLPSVDERSFEVEFQSLILKESTKIKKAFTDLNLDEEVNDVKIRTYGNAVIPLSMRDVIEERYENVKIFIKDKKKY